jgi:hypothetical protein
MPSRPVPLPPGVKLNVGLTPIGAVGLRNILGSPNTAPLPPHVSGGPCFPVSNPRLEAFMVQRKVGPFSVTGLQPAVDSLADVMLEIKQNDPGLHSRLGTAGMLCVRRIANSRATSNHAWGTAVDVKVDSVLNIVGNGMALPELFPVAEVFNRHGWFWGAEFPLEDSMHFELSLETMTRWQQEGRFSRDPILQHGHIGTKVVELQKLINRSGVTAPLVVDRVFGDDTLAAVEAFQRAKGLEDDGVVGKNTWAALRA